jgi:hypothetical protein
MAEITSNDEFGKAIIDCIVKYNLANNLEIGSWDGTGSTQCFIEGMLKLPEPIHLHCIEINESRYKDLCTNTQFYSWISCHNTTSVNITKLPDFDSVWDSKFNGIKNNTSSSRELVKKWYDDDKNLMMIFGKGFLESTKDSFDGVLIDGSEFTGFEEFKLLKNRTRVFFLDDAYNAFKTRQASYELSIDPEWKLESFSNTKRNGYAIYVKNV